MSFFQFVQTTSAGPNPLFNPNYVNVEFFFNLVPYVLQTLLNIFGSSHGDIDIEKYRAIARLIVFFLWVAIILLICGIIYCVVKIKRLIRKDEEKFHLRRSEVLRELATAEENLRWKKILELMSSPSESDWRLAILEADNILGELLERMQFPGESIGDRLKGVEVSDFSTLSQAWEAHKVRNQIAHEGLGILLTQREADRVIDLYRQVFEEFHYI